LMTFFSNIISGFSLNWPNHLRRSEAASGLLLTLSV
jgi:hypothetical protein